MIRAISLFYFQDYMVTSKIQKLGGPKMFILSMIGYISIPLVCVLAREQRFLSEEMVIPSHTYQFGLGGLN